MFTHLSAAAPGLVLLVVVDSLNKSPYGLPLYAVALAVSALLAWALRRRAPLCTGYDSYTVCFCASFAVCAALAALAAL
jgi:hypothetical protein